MHMVSTIVIVQQYGLPEILPILSRVDTVSRDLYTMPVPQPLHNIPYVTLVARSGPTLNGPHQLMMSVL
jgi:hypothetical protein